MASTPSMDSQSASSAGAASSAQPQYFVDSTKGNIKEVYSFQQKLANGGFGIVYLAEHRESHQKYAIKAIQKKKLKDYTTFINEINILKILVSDPHPPAQLWLAGKPWDTRPALAWSLSSIVRYTFLTILHVYRIIRT